MSVVFINLFEVPAGRDDAFRAQWQQVNDYLTAQPGYQDRTPALNVLIDPLRARVIEVRDPRTYTLGETIQAWQRALHEGSAPHRQRRVCTARQSTSVTWKRLPLMRPVLSPCCARTPTSRATAT